MGSSNIIRFFVGETSSRTEIIDFSMEKQAKNRDETSSNLSLGTRLTKVKGLSRKSCCNTTPGRCQEGCRLTILFHIYHTMLLLLPKSKVGGIPGLEAYHKKYAQRRRLRRNSLPNDDFRF